MDSRSLFTVVFVLASAIGAQAQETHAIKLHESKPGDVVRVVQSKINSNVIQVKDAAGNALKDVKETTSTTENYVETILERPKADEKPTKLKRVYEKFQRVKDGAKESAVYEGKTVLIEKKDGKFRFQVEGGEELTGSDAESLDKEFNKKGKSIDKLLMPAKPVKVGDTWTPETDAILKELNADGDFAAKIAVVGKLEKVYQKNGQKFGVMDFVIEVTVKALGKDDQALKLDPQGKMTMKGKMDVCIDGATADGTAKMAMQLEGQSKLSRGDVDLHIAITGRASSGETRTQLDRK